MYACHIMPRVAKKTASSTRSKVVASRSSKRYTGRSRGGYWTGFKKRWAEGGGSMKDQFKAAGSILAGPIGDQVGGLLNRALYAITGFGDYNVKSNILVETNSPPTVVNRSNKEFVVRHREYIQDIYSSAGANNSPSPFGVLAFPINPGDTKTFPWLSSIADKFEQYRIEGMLFEYKSLYSDAVVTQNGSIGSIVLATEYNSGAPLFATKQAMENYQFAQSSKPSVSILHPVECARSQNVLSELYIRGSTVPAGEDVKTYDFGDFQIASQGIPLGPAGAAVNLGELWVTYQIALIKPRIPSGSVSYPVSGFASFAGVSENAGFLPYGTIPVSTNSIVKRPISNINVNLTADNTYTIACGSTVTTYEVNMEWYAFNVSATPLWRVPTFTLTNCTYVNSSSTGPYQIVRAPIAAAIDTGARARFFINVPAATPSLPNAVVLVQPGNFMADQTNAVRYECTFNIVPFPLN